ncbi:MAG: hypothetical protein JSS55_05520 [Proteobacteria bacterium]|nr:hypothetical protein [Pseudomonadota bacterium]
MTDTVTPAQSPATDAGTAADTAPTLDAIKEKLNANETVAKAKAFAKERPWATAAAAGVIGLAILNTLRGRR